MYQNSQKMKVWSYWEPISKEILSCAMSGKELSIKQIMEAQEINQMMFDHLM